MDLIFEMVAAFLFLAGHLTGLTYNEINIIVYFMLIPFSWVVMLDKIFCFHWLKIGFTALCAVFFVFCPNFEMFSDSLFIKSVTFLMWFKRYGMDYITASVVICVLVPLLVYITLGLMLYWKYRMRKQRRQIIYYSRYNHQIMKRYFDIIFSLIALAVFAIPMTVIALLLIIKEKHPVIFRQKRIGLSKNPFDILKFQTMVNEVPTGTGKFLRKAGLDELPQFFNVLKGDMSIVGPRALTQSDIERLKWDDEYHKIRWAMNPGITGFAQIYGGQHRKTSWFWDKYYIKHHGLLIDFGIILISFLMNMFGKTKVRRIIFRKKNLK
jgi:lipopolysaccharide/colanic/teichoic acid biosynthesis glycosyltransferase